MGGWTGTIYRYCPVWVQNAGISLYGLSWRRRRMGGIFRSEVEAFSQRDCFSADQWQHYQTQQLRELLPWCFRFVPHYQKAWTQRDIGLADLERFELSDLPKLPLLEKDQ